MRISDWSSDVCSSDLLCGRGSCVSVARDHCGHNNNQGRFPRCRRSSDGQRGPSAWRYPLQDARQLHEDECPRRSEEHTSELQSLMRISYAVFCLKKKKIKNHTTTTNTNAINTYRTNITYLHTDADSM